MVQASFTVTKTPMISEVTISNFKGIKGCEIKDISKVNLFIGKNDCGKSSIIEAMYLTCKECIGANLPFALRRRSNREHISYRELWYGYNTDSEIVISLVFDTKIDPTLTVEREAEYIRPHLKTSYPQSWDEEQAAYHVPDLLVASMVKRLKLPHPEGEAVMHYFDNAQFLDCSIRTDLKTMEGPYLSRIKQSAEDKDLGKKYAEIYTKEANWEFMPHHDYPKESRVAIFERGKRIYLENFGDGLRYGLAILSGAKIVYNTGLFIEEIESHQHPGSLNKLIKNLIEIANRNNLQLFVTTHSPEAFRSLYYCYKSPEERKKDFRCFHVTRNIESGEVTANVEEDYTSISRDIFEVE